VSPELRAWLRRSREASGVPEKIEDPAGLAQLAALLRQPGERRSATRRERAA
jgi:hypothetical protein